MLMSVSRMETAQLINILQRYPLFCDLSQRDLVPLIAGHRFKNVQHHEALYSVGDPALSFAVVLSGAFKLVRPTPRGEDAIMYFAIPGDIIGALVMLKANTNYPVSAIAMGHSTVIILSRAIYREAWLSSQTVQTKLNAMLYSRMCILQDEKANQKLPLQQRIASLFIKTLDRQPQAGDSRLPIPLTRQEIADAVGASVESVIRSMSEMSQAGLIKTEDKHIEILDTEKLIGLLKVN